jgi:hypothetical protein
VGGEPRRRDVLRSGHHPARQPVQLGLVHVRVDELDAGRELVGQHRGLAALLAEVVAVRAADLLTQPPLELGTDVAAGATQANEQDGLV